MKSLNNRRRRRRLWIIILFLLLRFHPSSLFLIPVVIPLKQEMTSLSSPTSVIMNLQAAPADSTNDGSSFRRPTTKHNPRSFILQVGVVTGRLCSLALSHLPHIPNHPSNHANNSNDRTYGRLSTGNPPASKTTTSAATTSVVLVLCLAELLQSLLDTAHSVNISLSQAIRNKLLLNQKKYPVELCKVRP